MRIETLFPSKYVSAADLGGHDVTVEIERLTLEEMGNPPEKKPVLWFRKATKGLVVNKTNGLAIAKLHGPETDAWGGKRVTLYATKVKAFGEVHEVIRVRPQVPPPPKGGQPAAPAGPGNAPSASSGTVEDAGLDELEEVREQIEEEEGPNAGPEDDNPWFDAMREVDTLGADVYGARWSDVRVRNVQRVSGRRTEMLEDLSEDELEKLRRGLLALAAGKTAVPVNGVAQPA